MAIGEQARRDLERRLVEVLGEESARTLMTHLPEQEPATKADLDALGARLGTRMDGLKRNLIGLRQELRQEMGSLEQRLNDRIDLKYDTLRYELLAAFHEGMGEGMGSLRAEMASQTRTFVIAVVGSLASISALGFAALRFT